MVNSAGQLYTIEGIAAGILMLTTAYLVLSTTSIYTPAETHISDMQLEQLGSDALLVMDTPSQSLATVTGGGENNELALYIERNDSQQFSNRFKKLISTNGTENINFITTIYYRNSSGIQKFNFTSAPIVTNRERRVSVSRLVMLKTFPPTYLIPQKLPGMDNRNQTVLVEVQLWRG